MKATTTTTTMKPKSKTDIVEPEIDIENVPILQGSFEVTKTDADITEKRMRTSTLKPFTITNGSVRMKPKKTTVEKVKPLPKIPETFTANIMKLENVTKSFQYEKMTTPRAPTTTEEIPTTTTMEFEISSSSEATTTTKIPRTTTFGPIERYEEMSSSRTSTETVFPSDVLPSEPQQIKPVNDLSTLEGEILTHSNKRNLTSGYPSTIVLDDQPWLPIAPNVKIDHNLNDAKKKIHNSVSPPVIPSSYNTDPTGFHLLPRNKLRSPITSTVQKTNRPPVYHSYNNPALMYGLHEIEKLGNSFVKPYPIPVDLISEQLNKKDDDLILNKGEVLPSIKEPQPSSIETTTFTIATTPVYGKYNENKTEGSITLNIEETTDKNKNKSDLTIDDEVTNQQVGEILLDLLKDSNVKLNESGSDDLLMQSRTEELDLPELKKPEMRNHTEPDNLPEEVDHTEALEEIATVLSSMETLSFKNIKDYIMATTKSITKDILVTSTERDQTTPRREKPQNIDPMVKSDRISLIAPTTPVSVVKATTTTTTATTTTENPISQESDVETVTSSFVEVETVQYTPSESPSWSPGLFPVQPKWEYINGTLVYPSVAPMRKIFNETLQAWIIENPMEPTERLPPTELIRNSSEPLKNISVIFDTLASKLSINTMESAKLPPFMSHFTAKKQKNEQQQQLVDHIASATKKPTQTTIVPSTPSTPSADELPILLNQNTESYYGSSAETLIGQAEVEEVDPTQFEQMLLIDRVSSALRPTSTAPSLVTLMPVKSNSGLRPGFANEKLKGSARGFPPASQSTSNRRRFEDTSFVVRTSMNISS